ncbi:MAG: 16S rRNA (uracil(1498)-N(3))-methyltransferase [Pseudomonadota bacterium]
MIIRLFVDDALAAGARVALSADQSRYLRTVMRRGPGDALKIFNARDGEFDATLDTVGKKDAAAALGDRSRAPPALRDLELLFAPVKRAAVEMIVQKGAELGVTQFAPVVTARTNAARLNVDRLVAIAIEATEQCGRLDPPRVSAPQPLTSALDAAPADRLIVFADEAGDDPNAPWGGEAGRAAPMLQSLAERAPPPAGASILIGPEGGFTPAERAALRARDSVAAVTLGPRILRADTAAIAALSLWQAACGDWR